MQIIWDDDDEREAYTRAACSFGIQVDRGQKEASRRSDRPRENILVGHAVSAHNKGDYFLSLFPDDIEETIRHGIHNPEEAEGNKNSP